MTHFEVLLIPAVDAFLKHGPEAVSHIHRELRTEGWRGLGHLADFTDTLRRLGFRVEHGRNHRGGHRIEVHPRS